MGKKYSVQMEDGQVVSVEVDGVSYANPDDIPDEQDREAVEDLIARMEDDGDGSSLDREFEQDLQEMRRQSVIMPKVLTGIFLLIALIMLVIAAVSTVNTLQALQREVSAPGVVVDMTLRSTRDSQTGEVSQYGYPVVQFTPAGRSPRTVQLSEGSWPPAYAQGDEVTILYDADQPNNARIQSASSTVLMWILPGVTGIVGLAFAGAALMVFKVFWPKPEEEQAVVTDLKSPAKTF